MTFEYAEVTGEGSSGRRLIIRARRGIPGHVGAAVEGSDGSYSQFFWGAQEGASSVFQLRAPGSTDTVDFPIVDLHVDAKAKLESIPDVQTWIDNKVADPDTVLIETYISGLEANQILNDWRDLENIADGIDELYAPIGASCIDVTCKPINEAGISTGGIGYTIEGFSANRAAQRLARDPSSGWSFVQPSTPQRQSSRPPSGWDNPPPGVTGLPIMEVIGNAPTRPTGRASGKGGARPLNGKNGFGGSIRSTIGGVSPSTNPFLQVGNSLPLGGSLLGGGNTNRDFRFH